MQRDLIVRRLTEIQDRIDATTRTLGVVESLVARTPKGRPRLALVNLIVGATDERARQTAEVRRLFRSERPRIECDFGALRAAEYFADMEAREGTERALEETWREMVVSLAIAPAVSSA
jgi:hypothetical protein